MSNAPQPDTQPASRSPDLVRHMVGCQPCDGHLGALKSTPDVLDHLVNAGRAEDTSSRVEGVLAVAGRQGDLELQRLLYELGRSSLALIPEFREGKAFSELQPHQAVSNQLHAMLPRAEAAGPSELCSSMRRLPLENATRPERPAELALSFGEVLEKAQDQRAQGTFLIGDALHALGDLDRSLATFTCLHESARQQRLRLAAAHNVMHVLISAGRYSEVVDFARSHRVELMSDPLYWINTATAQAWLGARDEARESLRSLSRPDGGTGNASMTSEWWEDQASFFSEHLGCSVDEARGLLTR